MKRQSQGCLCIEDETLLCFCGGVPAAVYSSFCVPEFLRIRFPVEQFTGTPSGESDRASHGNAGT